MASGRGPGVNAGYQSQHGKQRNDGAAAVAHKGQGQADNRGNADAHANITANLEDQGCGAAVAHQLTQIVLAPGADLNAPGSTTNSANNKTKDTFSDMG